MPARRNHPHNRKMKRKAKASKKRRPPMAHGRGSGHYAVAPLKGEARHRVEKELGLVGEKDGVNSGIAFDPGDKGWGEDLEMLYWGENIDPAFKGVAIKTTNGTILKNVNCVQEEMAKDGRVRTFSSSDMPEPADDNPDRKPFVAVGVTGFNGKALLKSIKASVMKFSKEQLHALDPTSRAWQTWCDDAVLYGCANHVINGVFLKVCPAKLVKNWDEIDKSLGEVECTEPEEVHPKETTFAEELQGDPEIIAQLKKMGWL